MKSGVCPKCHSTDVRLADTRGERNYLRLGVMGFSGVRIHEYICPDCGFMESYVVNPARVRARCRRVKDGPA